MVFEPGTRELKMIKNRFPEVLDVVYSDDNILVCEINREKGIVRTSQIELDSGIGRRTCIDHYFTSIPSDQRILNNMIKYHKERNQ